MSAILPFLPAIISAAGSIGGALLSGNQKETPIQGQQREIIDQILQSVKGNGPFSDMFKMDDQAFQKSYVDPAKERFSSQIAPQIQQSYIQSGQQRGTGLDDTLTRAGVDLDQILNQAYSSFQGGAQDRLMNAINSILGSGQGVGEGMSLGEKAGAGLQGFVSSKALPKSIDLIIEQFKNKGNRQGFENQGGTL